MEPEKIVRNIGEAVSLFIAGYNPSAAERFRDHLNDWDAVWPRICEWLDRSEEALRQGTVATILSFVRNIPGHESFLDKLHVSLAFHRDFWDDIHRNFNVARQRMVVRSH